MPGWGEPATVSDMPHQAPLGAISRYAPGSKGWGKVFFFCFKYHLVLVLTFLYVKMVRLMTTLSK